jgi:hypothetical protein
VLQFVDEALPSHQGPGIISLAHIKEISRECIKCADSIQKCEGGIVVLILRGVLYVEMCIGDL